MPFALGNAAAAIGYKTLDSQVEKRIDEIKAMKPGQKIEIVDELTGRIIEIVKNEDQD